MREFKDEVSDPSVVQEQLLGSAREGVRNWLTKKAEPVLNGRKRKAVLFRIPSDGHLPFEVLRCIPDDLCYPASGLLNEGLDLFLEGLGINRSDFKERQERARARMRRRAHPYRGGTAQIVYQTDKPDIQIIYGEGFMRRDDAFPQSKAWMVVNKEVPTFRERLVSVFSRGSSQAETESEGKQLLDVAGAVLAISLRDF